VGRGALTGAITPLLLAIAGAPVSYLTLADDPNRAVVAVFLGAVIAVAGAVALPVLAEAGRHRPPETGDRLTDRYAVAHGALHLVVFGVLWLTALPDVLDAEAGRTPDGAPVGSPLYAAAGALVSGWVLLGAPSGRWRRQPAV
jgi:hypothetical protein